MKRTFQAALATVALAAAGHAAAQITLYEGEGFRGHAITTNDRVWNLDRMGFNDRASSIVVERGRWEVCEHARFEGRCVVLRRGSYPSLREFGMNNTISSLRPIEGGPRHGRWDEPEPVAGADYQWRVRPNERIFEVPVKSAVAVMGPPNQRCWVERQQVAQPAPANQPNIGGAVIGGIVGGILGHQIGGGSGKDAATAAGVIGGAVVGNNIANQNGGGGTQIVNRDVQRCEQVPATAPAYWDVTYSWRGMDHHVQMSAAPGATIRINGNGEPRM